MQADNHISSDLYINNSLGVNFAKLTCYDTLNTYKFLYDGVGEIAEPTTIDELDIYSAVEFKSSTKIINGTQ